MLRRKPTLSKATDTLKKGNEAAQIAKDLSLVADLRAGHPTAPRRLAERMQCVPRILRALNVRMGRPLSEHDLQDLTQETLMIILRKLDEYRGLSSIEGWVYRICYFELANWSRRRGRERREELTEEQMEATRVMPKPDPWKHEDLYRALERLPEEERQVVHLKHFQDMTFEAISREVRAKLSTVKARYYRGLDFLSQVRSLERS